MVISIETLSSLFSDDPLGAAARAIVFHEIVAARQFECRPGQAQEVAAEFVRASQRTRDALKPIFIDGLEAQIRAHATDREVAALFSLLLRAAAEATSSERMKMLSTALAGIWNPYLSAEMRSRVARALLQLEPGDVVFLHEFYASFRGSGSHDLANRSRRQIDTATMYLPIAGCLYEVYDEDNGRLYVTRLGRAVLAAVMAWAPEGGQAIDPLLARMLMSDLERP